MAIADDGADAEGEEASNLRLLPVPIFITEPAIGKGLGASLMFIHPRQKRQTALASVSMPDAGFEASDGQRQPPNVTAVFGAFTDADVARGPEDDVWYIQVGHAW